MEWLPKRMMDGRALELDARFEIACVRGSMNTSAVSTGSRRAVRVRAWDRAENDEDRAGGVKWDWLPLAFFSVSEGRSPSSESLSSEVSRSSIAFWIVVGIRSKKSVGDAGAGAEWMTGGRILPGIVKESGLPSPRRAAIGTVGDVEDDVEANEESAGASCTEWMSSTAGERGLRLFADRVSDADALERSTRDRGGIGSEVGETEEDTRGGGETAERGVAGSGGSSGSECNDGDGWDAMLLRDITEDVRQLPKTASPKADAVGEGIENSDTDTDIDGRPNGSDSVMEGRPLFTSRSVSKGVLNDISSLEYLDSLSVRERVAVVVNDGMPSMLFGSGVIPRPGRGGGERETTISAAASSALDNPVEGYAFGTV